MRNAFGLMLASVASAVVIAAFWFWTSPPRAEGTAPQTVAARPAEKLPAAVAAKPVPDVEVTAALSTKPPAPMPQKSTCANADALGVSRVVVIDTVTKNIIRTFDNVGRYPWSVTIPRGQNYCH